VSRRRPGRLQALGEGLGTARRELQVGVPARLVARPLLRLDLASRPLDRLLVVSRTGLTMKIPTAARIATVVTILMIGLITVPAPITAASLIHAVGRSGSQFARVSACAPHEKALDAQYARRLMSGETEKWPRTPRS
jgi:hypothetical protein